MTRHRLLVIAATWCLALAGVGPTSAATAGSTIRVPQDYPTVEDAIRAASRGDTILLAAGTYDGEITVPQGKPDLTIRGTDRNTVVFDGAGVRNNAIEVEADGVTLENLSAHDYLANGFYWEEVSGFAGRGLTVWNVGLYGVYAIQSRGGTIEQSYVSGAADAAFYIGECFPCDTVVRGVTAKLSAVGYSGTNAGGNMRIEDSTFEDNGVGILPNSYDVGLQAPPQRAATFRHNVVRGSGSVPTPRATPLAGFTGVGIGVIGGIENVIEDNEVTGSARYGIVVTPAIDREATWTPAANRIENNRVSGSGLADLALARGSGPGNCFVGNTAGTTDPPDLAADCSATGSGSAAVADAIALPPPQMLGGLPSAPPFGSMPAPGELSQPAPDEAVPGGPPLAAAAAVVLLLGLGGLFVLLRFRRKRDQPIA